MAERNEQVFERVREELRKNQAMGSRDLYELGQSVDTSIADETLQQFHARYVLPIKREEAAKRGGGRRVGRRRARKTKAEQPGATGQRRRRTASADRDQVRAVFLEFARDFADADSRAEIVQVLSRVDDYVDRIAPAGG